LERKIAYNGVYLAKVFSPQSLFRVEARMIQLEFTPEAIAALHHERYHHPHPRVQRKMDVLLLKSHGRSHKQIASITRVSVNTVTSYVRAYHQGGIDQ
jgi:DNA-binding NarL/FixJ family response regulator